MNDGDYSGLVTRARINRPDWEHGWVEPEVRVVDSGRTGNQERTDEHLHLRRTDAGTSNGRGPCQPLRYAQFPSPTSAQSRRPVGYGYGTPQLGRESAGETLADTNRTGTNGRGRLGRGRGHTWVANLAARQTKRTTGSRAPDSYCPLSSAFSCRGKVTTPIMKQSDRWVAIGVSMRKATRSRLPPTPPCRRSWSPRRPCSRSSAGLARWGAGPGRRHRSRGCAGWCWPRAGRASG